MKYQPKSSHKHAVALISAAMVGCSFVPVTSGMTFTDIEGNSHKEAIMALVDQEVIKGYPDGTFRPYASITRGDAAVMVARTFGLLNGANIPATTYTDLHTVNPVTQEAIAKLTHAGIVNGFSEKEFRPLETITRAQMAKYIANAFDLKIVDSVTPFPDVHRNAVLAPYVAAIAEAGITIGKKDGTFGYHDRLNRGDFAAMLYRAQNKVPPVDPPKINPITIIGDEKGNNLINGSAKTYTVTLINPVSDKPIADAELNVTFAENIGTDGKQKRNVIVTNAYGDSNVPFQADDGSVAEVKIKTDKNGKATFTITGSNATVTPIVFMDGSNQEWDTKGGFIIETQDGRFDEKYEYHAKAEPVTFSMTPYNITVEGKRTIFAAIAEKDEYGVITEHNGREYTIKVTKPDGTPFAGGTVNVGIYELLDRVIGNEPTGSYFPEFKDEDGNYLTQGQVKLNAKGEAVILLASTVVNESAKPVVWIDQNTAENYQTGILEDGEPVSDHTKVEFTNFQPPRVDNGSLGAELMVADNLSTAEKKFTMNILNQSGKPFRPNKEVKARVTFEVINTGSHRIEINTSLINNLKMLNVIDAQQQPGTVTIEVGGRATISGETLASTITLFANAVDGISSLSVRGSAVIGDEAGYESNSVYVYTEEVEAALPYSYKAEVAAEKKDTNGNGKADIIELTFTKEVYNIEPGDFRIGIVPASRSTKYGRKLILEFSEDALAGETILKYDPNYSGLEVLTDEFGNKVLPFTIVFPKEEPEEPEENEEEEPQNPIDKEEPEAEEPADEENETELEAGSGKEESDPEPEEDPLEENIEESPVDKVITEAKEEETASADVRNQSSEIKNEIETTQSKERLTLLNLNILGLNIHLKR